MSTEAVRAILEARLQTEWGVTTPIVWDNVNYTPKLGTPYIDCQLEGVFSVIKSAKCQRKHYLFTIDVYTPSNTTAKTAMEHTDTLETMFYGFASGYLTVQTTHSERVGTLKEWHHRVVLIDLFFDQHY